MTRLDGPGDDHDGGPGDAPDAVALDIADAVESLANLWSVAAQQAALRLSTHQLRALLVLEAATGLNLTALAERLGTGLPTASRLCDRLEAAGMLERSLHPEKRREVRLSLTAQGRRVLDDVAARRARALAAVLAGMDPAERSALRRALKAFLAARSAGSGPPEAP
ncbi:MarR family transcriptional regulator [Streptomyces toyocaensis]|uniref:MarR family transcriptional regulator n=1 Tax=Streptomyces toyocaensis TaxID=55952 RepID=A0A081XKK0_STRTO|nr:MarR family transcriptional regulator [Streptomyces toyocaensis]KES04073.1 MarR family transcriptional regulator [Streptomyces toyocaensis]